MLEAIVNQNKDMSLGIRSVLLELPPAIKKPLHIREEQFFAVSPDNPNEYKESYEDIFVDSYAHVRSDSFKQKAIYEAEKDIHKVISVYAERIVNKDSYDKYSFKKDYILESRYDNEYSRNNYDRKSRAEIFSNKCTGLIDVKEIIGSVDRQISDKSNIKAIVFFGPAAEISEDVTIEKNRLGKIVYRSKRFGHNFKKEVHDIDILILLKTDAPKTKSNILVDAKAVLNHDGYYDSRIVKDGYDIVAMTTNEYEDDIADGGFMSKSIRDTGILLVGSFPYQLSESKIEISRSGRVKWKPKKIIVKNLVKQKRKQG